MEYLTGPLLEENHLSAKAVTKTSVAETSQKLQLKMLRIGQFDAEAPQKLKWKV